MYGILAAEPDWCIENVLWRNWILIWYVFNGKVPYIIWVKNRKVHKGCRETYDICYVLDFQDLAWLDMASIQCLEQLLLVVWLIFWISKMSLLEKKKVELVRLTRYEDLMKVFVWPVHTSKNLFKWYSGESTRSFNSY